MGFIVRKILGENYNSQHAMGLGPFSFFAILAGGWMDGQTDNLNLD